QRGKTGNGRRATGDRRQATGDGQRANGEREGEPGRGQSATRSGLGRTTGCRPKISEKERCAVGTTVAWTEKGYLLSRVPRSVSCFGPSRWRNDGPQPKTARI